MALMGFPLVLMGELRRTSSGCLTQGRLRVQAHPVMVAAVVGVVPFGIIRWGLVMVVAVVRAVAQVGLAPKEVVDMLLLAC